MGLFGLFGRDKKIEEEKKAEEHRAEVEREEIVQRQMKEHEKLTWPQIRPISPVRVRDDKGQESIPAILTDPVSRERKDEIGPLVFQPRINSDTIRFLSFQELIFVLTTMETFQRAAPLENFEGNRRIVYNEIISRLRDAERIFVIMDQTTGYPYLDHGHTLVYSEEGFATAAAGVLAAQYRRVGVRGYGGEGEPAVSSFFTYMFYMGAGSLLLDNGYYGARIDRAQIAAPPNITGTGQLPPINPPLNFALCEFLSEIRWPVKYDKREEILHEREAKMWSLIRAAHFIVPMQQEGPAELVGDKLRLGKETKLRFPMMTGPDGKTYLPIFTDGPEFAGKFAKDGWNGASFQWKDVLALIKERDGLIINPLTHKAVLTKERIAQMETAAALQQGAGSLT